MPAAASCRAAPRPGPGGHGYRPRRRQATSAAQVGAKQGMSIAWRWSLRSFHVVFEGGAPKHEARVCGDRDRHEDTALAIRGCTRVLPLEYISIYATCAETPDPDLASIGDRQRSSLRLNVAFRIVGLDRRSHGSIACQFRRQIRTVEDATWTHLGRWGRNIQRELVISRFKAASAAADRWPVSCSLCGLSEAQQLHRRPRHPMRAAIPCPDGGHRAAQQIGAGLAAQQARPAQLAEPIGRQMPDPTAGHFVTPTAQRNGASLGLDWPMIDANAYCVKL